MQTIHNHPKLPAPAGRIKRRLKQTVQLALLATLGLSLGCGKTETRVPVFPVTGKVSYGSEVPAGAQVVLHAVAGSNLPPDVAPSGVVKPDGSFKIGVYDEADGAPAGDYVATIQWFKIVDTGGGGGRGPNVLPQDYASATTSPVKVTVKSEPTDLAPIAITR